VAQVSEPASTQISTGKTTQLEGGFEMNWFERHLNWTYALSCLVALMAAATAGFVIGLTDPYYQNISEAAGRVIGELIVAVIVLTASAWVIHRKGQSLGWLLLAGWLSPLWLPNKNKESEPLKDVNLAND
jgi:hypothetical protein